MRGMGKGEDVVNACVLILCMFVAKKGRRRPCHVNARLNVRSPPK
jgi:hypothetical protein